MEQDKEKDQNEKLLTDVQEDTKSDHSDPKPGMSLGEQKYDLNIT